MPVGEYIAALLASEKLGPQVTCHRLFAPARLNITINDRFGHPVQPEEWFLVPLFVIDEAVARIKDGSITGYVYDPKAAKLVKAAEAGGA